VVGGSNPLTPTYKFLDRISEQRLLTRFARGIESKLDKFYQTYEEKRSPQQIGPQRKLLPHTAKAIYDATT